MLNGGVARVLHNVLNLLEGSTVIQSLNPITLFTADVIRSLPDENCVSSKTPFQFFSLFSMYSTLRHAN